MISVESSAWSADINTKLTTYYPSNSGLADWGGKVVSLVLVFQSAAVVVAATSPSTICILLVLLLTLKVRK